jgi:hypothetical protein
MRLILMTLVFAVAAVAASAQSGATAPVNAAERAAILNAMRAPVEKDLKQKIAFVVSRISVKNGWAFVSGEPQTPSGKRPSLKGTAWEGEPDMFDNNFFALLRKRGGKWRVVTHALGCTDVCYLDWDKTYKAPREIFGLPEGAR